MPSMPSEAFMQIRTALDTTTETTGGDSRTGVGAVFIQKEIDRMIRETINKDTDFRQVVPRKTIRQLAYIWNLETSMGSTAKAKFYSDGGTGVPYPNQYLQLFAPAKAMRSDYEVTGLTMAASASYFDALEREARTALQALALLEEQAFLFGDDTTADTTGMFITATYGVSGSYKGLYQLLDSAVAVADGYAGGFASTSSSYGTARSATTTDRGYKLNCKCVCTSSSASKPLSVDNLNAAITVSNIAGAKTHNRVYLCSERRMDEISALIAPQGRYVVGAASVELDGGQRVLTWRGNKIISSRFMTAYSKTSSNGSSITSTLGTDNCILFLDMDNISFYNVAGVDARHIPIMGADASQRSDVEGGYFKTYGVFAVERFDTQVIIYNLSAP
jgi:hypothetical protein